MDAYLLIKAWIRRFNYAIAMAGTALVFITMFITTADVIGRYFRMPLPGAMEISELALGVMVFLGWAYTQAEKGHIAIDILFKRLPRRARNILDVIIPLVGLVLMGLIGWRAIWFGMDSKSSLEQTVDLGIPVWPFKLMILIGAVTLCLELIFDVIEAWQRCRES
jgi:TRAP-type C4-dicarboxylate transport system permease small subunit